MESRKLKQPISPKERGLLKGAIRRLFSRSELRLSIIQAAEIKHHDVDRPRVTKWVSCDECGLIFPRYLAEVDHIKPIIALGENLGDLPWDCVIERVWCDPKNLRVVDKECHKVKTAEENRTRREYKKGKK